ncbi:MFS transporter [Paraburkholderia sediminicola]|uniref:MFS transporter n=1 Tax=Paraburkholderia sediminicola TaxID=458836 RepID=UPI0038BB1124
MENTIPATDTHSPTALRITLICIAVSMIDGFDTLMLSFVAPLLVKSLQIDHASLGRVFSAGFVGTVLGSFIVGPAADQFGRRRMLISALAVTGVLTLCCAFVHSATTLAALRFVGGLGMGGAIPPVAAIAAENGETKYQSVRVILMSIGFPLGAVIGGAISSVTMVQFGWASVFVMGGAFALIVILPVFFCIPRPSTRRAAPLQGVAPRRPQRGYLFLQAFRAGRLPAILALWSGVLAIMILSGFIVSFMPTILNLSGVPVGRAAFGVVVFNLGAITGALSLSAVVVRAGPFIPVAVLFLAGGGLVFALGHLLEGGSAAFIVLFVAGACLVGGQLAFPAMASQLFPEGVRAAGIGWTLGIGRGGSIIGPLVGGLLLSRLVPLKRVFMMASTLALLAAACIALAQIWLARIDDRR